MIQAIKNHSQKKINLQTLDLKDKIGEKKHMEAIEKKRFSILQWKMIKIQKMQRMKKMEIKNSVGTETTSQQSTNKTINQIKDSEEEAKVKKMKEEKIIKTEVDGII